MLSTCGDKRLLSSCLSPHRICTLVCIREMLHWETWQHEGRDAGGFSDSNNFNSTINFDVSSVARSYSSEMARRNIYIAIYRLTQCAEVTSKDELVLELRDRHQCCDDFIDAFKLAVDRIAESPLDSLLDLFVILPEVVSEVGGLAISGTSTVGVYIRQSILAFNRLDFAQIEKVGRKLCDFISPPTPSLLVENTDSSDLNGGLLHKRLLGASKSFVDIERVKGLRVEDQTVFLRNQPFALVDDNNDKNERQPDSYFSHHLDLLFNSFFLCSTDALVSYFSRNFKNRMPDIVIREANGTFLLREMKSKTAICSSRFETILLGYIAGISGDAAGCRSLLIDATKQCHSAGDVVGVELANLISLLVFGAELTSSTKSAIRSSIQALLEQPTATALTHHQLSTSVPLSNDGLKFLAFVNFYKAVINVLRSDEKSTSISSQIASLTNGYLPIIDRATQSEAVSLSLVLTQAMSLVYRLHGQTALATSLDLVTLYMNAEFMPGCFFGTAPVLRAWQDLAVNNWTSQNTVSALWQRIDSLFPHQPEASRQLVNLSSIFKNSLISGEYSAAESLITQLFSVDKNEAAVLCASYLLETGQFYELDQHFNKMLDFSDSEKPRMSALYRFRLELIRGLYLVAINDLVHALDIFDEIIKVCDAGTATEGVNDILSTTITTQKTTSTCYNNYGIKALVYLYKSLVLLRLGFTEKARDLLNSKATILCRVCCSSFIVGQAYYLLGLAEALSSSFGRASSMLDQAGAIFTQTNALPMLLHTFSASALIAQARGDAKARNLFAHKFLASRQELGERDRIWVDSDIWKLSPFYFIEMLTGSLPNMKN